MIRDLFWSTPGAKLGTLLLAAALVVYLVRLLVWLARRVAAVEPVFADDAVSMLRGRAHETDHMHGSAPRRLADLPSDVVRTRFDPQAEADWYWPDMPPRRTPAATVLAVTEPTRRLAIDALTPPASRPLAPPRLGVVHDATLAQASISPASTTALRERQRPIPLAPWRDLARPVPVDVVTLAIEPPRPTVAATVRRSLRDRLFGERHEGASLTSESPKTADHKATPTFTPTDLLTGDKSVSLEPYGVIGATDAPTYKMVAKDVHESSTAFALTTDAIATFGANIDSLLADFLGISVKAVHATVTCAHDRTEEIDGDALAALLAMPTGELVSA